jgi:hypothetical protein
VYVQNKTLKSKILKNPTNNHVFTFTNQTNYSLLKTNLPPTINLLLLENPLLLKLIITKSSIKERLLFSLPNTLLSLPYNKNTHNTNNILPCNSFSHTLLKKVYSSLSQNKINLNFIPIYYTTLIRFMENISGNKILIQFYPFVNQSVSENFIIKYKL